MAETNAPGASGGQAQTNATTTTGGGNAGAGGGARSSATAKTADLQDLPKEQNPARSTVKAGDKPVAEKTPTPTDSQPLPYPHTALSNVEVNASVYRDQIAEIMREHEELSKEGVQDFTPSPEMLAAREDAQARISVELRATLAAQRIAQGFTVEGQTGNSKVRLLKAHTHAGKGYKEGDEILVSEAEADFLLAARVGEMV